MTVIEVTFTWIISDLWIRNHKNIYKEVYLTI